MKKTIFALALMVTLPSCGASSTESSAPEADSTAVTVDSAACPSADSTCVDTCTAK